MSPETSRQPKTTLASSLLVCTVGVLYFHCAYNRDCYLTTGHKETNMREQRLFAANMDAYKRNAQRQVSGQVSALRFKIGACQAQISSNYQVKANQAWISRLNGQINKIKG